MSATMPTPLLHTIEPAAFTVRDGWRGQRDFRLDRSAITVDGTRLRYSDIESIGYVSTRRPYNLVQRRIRRRIQLGTAGGGLEICLGERAFGPSNAKQHQQGAYELMLTTLHALVEPRLQAQLLRSVAVGDAISIGPLRFDTNDLQNTETGERAEWRQLPSAQLEGTSVVVRVAIDHDVSPLATLPMLEPNAPLLPELLDEAAITFS